MARASVLPSGGTTVLLAQVAALDELADAARTGGGRFVPLNGFLARADSNVIKRTADSRNSRTALVSSSVGGSAGVPSACSSLMVKVIQSSCPGPDGSGEHIPRGSVHSRI